MSLSDISNHIANTFYRYIIPDFRFPSIIFIGLSLLSLFFILSTFLPFSLNFDSHHFSFSCFFSLLLLTFHFILIFSRFLILFHFSFVYIFWYHFIFHVFFCYVLLRFFFNSISFPTFSYSIPFVHLFLFHFVHLPDSSITYSLLPYSLLPAFYGTQHPPRPCPIPSPSPLLPRDQGGEGGEGRGGGGTRDHNERLESLSVWNCLQEKLCTVFLRFCCHTRTRAFSLPHSLSFSLSIDISLSLSLSHDRSWMRR